MKITSNTAPLISKLFTVRNRPVLFARMDAMFPEALYAIDRGAFPISPTGYRSMAGCLCRASGDIGKYIDGIISPEFLESLAIEHERNAKGAKTRANRSAKRRFKGTVRDFISLEMDAVYAARHGLFASSQDRRELWQVAWRLLYLICDSGLFIPQKMADVHGAWNIENCQRHLARARKNFALLRQLMSGDFDVKRYDCLDLVHCVGSMRYFELPPKPDGEPVIPSPDIEMDLDFTGETASSDDEDDNDDDLVGFDDARNVCEAPASTGNCEQLTMF